MHATEDRFQPLLTNLCLIRRLAEQYVPNQERDDFRQELALRMMRALERGVFSPQAWLRVAARNLSIDWKKGAVRGAEVIDEQRLPASPEREPAEVIACADSIAALRDRCGPAEQPLFDALLRGATPRDIAAGELAGGGGAEPVPVQTGKQRSRVFRLLRRLRGSRDNSAA